MVGIDTQDKNILAENISKTNKMKNKQNYSSYGKQWAMDVQRI